MKHYEEFSIWLDKYLEGPLPKEVTAINFNLYEGANDDTYAIQMIGSDEFDEDDEDWACSEVFSTEEDIFFIPKIKEIEDWEAGLCFIKQIVEKYLIEGKYADRLKSYTAVGIGFVDGDLEVLHLKR